MERRPDQQSRIVSTLDRLNQEINNTRPHKIYKTVSSRLRSDQYRLHPNGKTLKSTNKNKLANKISEIETKLHNTQNEKYRKRLMIGKELQTMINQNSNIEDAPEDLHVEAIISPMEQLGIQEQPQEQSVEPPLMQPQEEMTDILIKGLHNIILEQYNELLNNSLPNDDKIKRNVDELYGIPIKTTKENRDINGMITILKDMNNTRKEYMNSKLRNEQEALKPKFIHDNIPESIHYLYPGILYKLTNNLAYDGIIDLFRNQPMGSFVMQKQTKKVPGEKHRQVVRLTSNQRQNIPIHSSLEQPRTEINKNECVQLFDPCTKEPTTLDALEKRLKEIKKQRDITPVGLYGLTNETSNYDFIMNVFVNPLISLDDMVSFKLSEGRKTTGSDIYEVLSRLFVFFGGISGVNPRDGGNYAFMDRVEGGRIYSSTREALQSMKCIASKGSGISDITLIKINVNQNTSKNEKPDIKPYCETTCIDTNKDQSSTPKTYLMSVKWRTKEKNAENVDLEKLRIAQQELLKEEQKPSDLIVFIKSKKDYQISNNRMYRQYVQHLAKTFFGWNEDVKPFLEEIRRNIFELGNLNFNDRGENRFREALLSQYFIPNSLPILSLQLHQDIIVKGVCDRIDTSSDNLYLIGVLPRGGKTFIAGGIIREYIRRDPREILNILWLTAAPNETLSQVRVELIDKFGDFNDFEFVDIREGGKKTQKPHTVYFCSSQLLISSEKPTATQRLFLNNLKRGIDNLGLVFFDEAHKTGTGDMTKETLQLVIHNYIHINLPIIFLTATYYNILFDYQIQKSNTFLWDYTDVLATRSLATETDQTVAINNLKSRFGPELVNYILQKRLANNETLETMAKAYIGFPDLFFISADFQKEAIQRFRDQGKYNEDSGFSLSSIFAIKPVKRVIKNKNGMITILNPDGLTLRDIKTANKSVRKDAFKVFDNLTNPKNIISLLTPTKEQFTNPDLLSIPGGEPLTKETGSILEPSILGRINKMSSETKSRFRLDEQPTILMFMPTGGPGTNIYYLLCAWASLLMAHPWWSLNYEVACVVEEQSLTGEEIASLLESGLESSEGIHIISDNLKSRLLSLERELHCREKSKGLMILAGEKLSMGISLPCTDVVILLNEKKSPDDIIQKMYRALTPSPGKTAAFVVDLNPVRTFAAVYGYTRASHEASNTKTEILDIIYDTYSWDSDVFEYSLRKGSNTSVLRFQERLKELLEKAERDPDNEYKINEDIGGYEKRLSNNIRSKINSEFVSKLASQFSTKKMEDALSSIGLKDRNISIKKGKLVITRRKEPNPDDPEFEPEESIEIVIDNFIETVTDFVKYLAITSTASILEGALEEYEFSITNPSESSLRQNILSLVRSRTIIQQSNNISQYENDIVLSKLLIAAVKDLAFNSSKDIFRQMKGKIEEISTRKNKILNIIHRHLTPRNKQKKEFGEVFTPIKLIEEMFTHLPKSVWENPKLTWLDPASGIGNFPIVAFYKLDEGLKTWQPNENKRRKHIIENMLYMIEIQSSNTRISRTIFKKLCDGCEPNIITTDSLKITSSKLAEKKFPVKYDVVIGNPPFNPGAIWWKFIEKYSKLATGYMLFIVPSTFTSNSTGEKVVEYLKLNGLKAVRYLELSDFNNKINLDTLYFVLENGYNGEININNLININRTSPIINLKNKHDSSIFSKLLEYIKTKGHVKLFKGKNETLKHKDPLETDNIKFKQTEQFNRRMLSRLGGGEHEYYWVHDFIKEEVDSPKIVFPRGTASYSSINNMLNLSKDIVYSTCVDKNEILSSSIMYVPLDSIDDCDSIRWYLMRSKLVRYIFMKVNHLAELTRTIFEYIPLFDVSKIKNDNDIYKELGFSEIEVKYIDSIFSKGYVKNTEDQEESEQGGGSRKNRRFNKTRKLRRG